MTETLQRTWPELDEVIGDIRRIIGDAQDIGCLTHIHADADSLGSALGFAEAIRAMGKRSHVIVPTPIPHLLEYLPGYDTIEVDPAPVDALFTFDCANVSRFGDKAPLVGEIANVVNVDHHVSNEGFGTVKLVEPAASATGQVVFKLLSALGAPVPPAAATNLYAALFTDTGGFRHENTTEEALRLGAELVRLGADAPWVAMKSYKSRSVGQVRLEGLAINRLRAELDGTLIWSEVTSGMLAEAGASNEETEGLVDMLQSIDTMKLAVLFKEDSDVTKLSVRSREPYDATVLCTPFGGGGHRRAAGAEVRRPLPETRDRVLAVARELIQGRG
ncbi:MAG: bifunctional oligoribonuclease/PAP phosphatase NrnA [Candidatus Dormibacteria bacterium]